MRKFVIVDDVFTSDVLLKLQYDLGKKSLPLSFYKRDDENQFKIYIDNLIKVAKEFYKIEHYIGYEFWSHNDTKTNLYFHYDKDELLAKKENKFSFPLLSIVFYPKIVNLKGGKLYLGKDLIIKPRENRLVLFPEGVYHGTSNYNKEGKRISFLINLWDKLPTSYVK